jgi:hypothetical protein
MPQGLRNAGIVCALICSALMPQLVVADDGKRGAQLVVWAQLTDRDGLVTQVPRVDRAVLLKRMTELRRRLSRHEEELEDAVEEKRLGVGDAIITAVIPGGLLYAGYRKHEWDEARDSLARVRKQLDTLSQTLINAQHLGRTMVVAQLQ